MIRAHHQLLAGVVGSGMPLSNAIDAWFSGGGLGVYYYAHPYYCYTDTAGTTHAGIGDLVARVNDRSGSGFYLTQSTSGNRPVLQYDATLGRYYFDFTASSNQRFGTIDSSLSSDWKWLHDGTEYQAVTLAQYGKSSNPNAAHTIWGTNNATTVGVGASMYYDDRASVPVNDAQRHQVTKGTSPPPINLTIANAITPNTPLVVSQSYANAVAGNDCILRVSGSVSGGAESGSAPATTDPVGRLTIGAMTNGTFPLDGRIYALALLRGSGARTGVASYEADI